MHALRLIGRGSRDTVDSSTLWCLPPALCRAGGAHTAREAHHRRSSSGSGSSGRGASTGVAADAAAELQLMDAIHMRGLLFHGHHGVFPEVRTAAAIAAWAAAHPCMCVRPSLACNEGPSRIQGPSVWCPRAYHPKP